MAVFEVRVISLMSGPPAKPLMLGKPEARQPLSDPTGPTPAAVGGQLKPADVRYSMVELETFLFNKRR